MKNKFAMALICVLLCGLCVVPGMATTCGNSNTNMVFPYSPGGVPKLPDEFAGEVIIGDRYAPDGTILTVWYPGGNTSIIVNGGSFGGGTFDEKLRVSNLNEGDILRFTINGCPCKILYNGVWTSYCGYHTGHYNYLKYYVPICYIGGCYK